MTYKIVLEKVYCFLYLQKMIGTKGVLLGEEQKKATVVKLCKKKIFYSLCTELLSLWAGYNKKNLNVVCIMIMIIFHILIISNSLGIHFMHQLHFTMYSKFLRVMIFYA